MFSISSLASTPDKPDAYPPIGARTKEGLVIFLQIAIHYKLTTTDDNGLKITQLVKIYSSFGKGWPDFLASLTESAIKDVCSRHGFEEFYTMRESIQLEMFTELSPEFFLYNMKLVGVYVLNIAFPSDLEDAVQSTENAKQEVEKYYKLQVREEILRDTRISIAQKSKQIKIAEAISIKNATTIQKTGELNAIAYIWTKYYNVLKVIEVKLSYITFIDCNSAYLLSNWDVFATLLLDQITRQVWKQRNCAT